MIGAKICLSLANHIPHFMIRPSSHSNEMLSAEAVKLAQRLQQHPHLISGFIDTYLKLNAVEEELFQAEISQISLVEQEDVMQIVTSWMEQGKQEEALSLIMRLLPRRIGIVETELQERIHQLSLTQLENLAEALLDFSSSMDLVDWLDSQVS